MGVFNKKLVEYLEILNAVLAGIFTLLAVVRFFELAQDDVIGAMLESVSVVGVGILTCGFIAVLCNINDTLAEMSKNLKIVNRIK